jgi:hypothetical protein
MRQRHDYNADVAASFDLDFSTQMPDCKVGDYTVAIANSMFVAD